MIHSASPPRPGMPRDPIPLDAAPADPRLRPGDSGLDFFWQGRWAGRLTWEGQLDFAGDVEHSALIFVARLSGYIDGYLAGRGLLRAEGKR